MASLFGLIGVALLGAAAIVGIFLGSDKVPLSITACGFAIAGGLSLVGSAIVEAAQILKSQNRE
ncbi:hypothetical protein VT84_22490 [Gemmata sp. SH-PL17]|uniref:hypothetical protein n=1 Tax=Gemmata sp. SH-PL17 TaxID=1630693 RepID=UPI0004B7FD01|nr:hypothetical protein [Gemmata sp. SH-PL17]AMV27188.1 hypothetical protein VT84_22490 [Gemmata sp. SH-PL17]